MPWRIQLPESPSIPRWLDFNAPILTVCKLYLWSSPLCQGHFQPCCPEKSDSVDALSKAHQFWAIRTVILFYMSLFLHQRRCFYYFCYLVVLSLFRLEAFVAFSILWRSQRIVHSVSTSLFKFPFLWVLARVNCVAAWVIFNFIFPPNRTNHDSFVFGHCPPVFW